MAELVDAQVLGTCVFITWRFKSSLVHCRLKKIKQNKKPMDEFELKSFLERVFEMKLSELFEEPSTFEDYVDNDFVLSKNSNNSSEV